MNICFSLLDIITEFRKEKGTSKFNPKQRLGEIIKIIESVVKSNPNKSNADIKEELLTGSSSEYFREKWNEGFHKLFIYEDILKAV